ncbi:MAG TPA: PD-(D/E)XK nuclease family protein [Candidatus Paceibacterota bacterium]|nr:PD-(D/E)XK nuclease family protein [Candidatus Paceibacterota bacterium]
MARTVKEVNDMPPLEAYKPFEGDEAAIEERLWPFEEVEPEAKIPISHWSHSSLMAYLRNPLAWYKRYVERVYDMPVTPSSVVGRAGHVALQHFYSGIPKEGAIDLGLEYLRGVPDFEINFGVAKTKKAKKEKRLGMEREYLQAINFYLAKPPKYDVVDVEIKATATVKGLALPIKAVSDLVVRSKVDKKALDVVDHKFVESFSKHGKNKTLFVMQALFNYYTVTETYRQPVRRFILHECKKTKNKDGSSQLKRYVIEYEKCAREFELFRQLVNDATDDLARRKVFLPNPSDMFEGENSFDIYRLGLASD